MKRRVFVVGNGITKFLKPREGNPDYPQLAKQAILRALRDAGLSYDVIQQAVVGYVYGDSTCGQRAVYEVGMTGIPIYNVNNNGATGSTTINIAFNYIRGGIADCILAVGFERMEIGSFKFKFPDRTSPVDKHNLEMNSIRQPTKAPISAQVFGNAGLEHQEKYGTKDEHFAKIAYKNHLHSVNNPYSQFRDKYTLEQIMKSTKIHGHLTKLQCCPTSDGAGAAILCSEEYIKKYRLEDQAVEIIDMVLATDHSSVFTAKSCMNIAGFGMSKAAATELYHRTGITPKDIQVIELHDCFSANELITYEALGLCPEGKASEWIDKNEFTYGGKYVVNPSGGLISKGNPIGATGLAQCAELCWQLKGMAQKRQVPNAKIALQHNLGLGGACVVALYKKYNNNYTLKPNQTSDLAELEKIEAKLNNTNNNEAKSSQSPLTTTPALSLTDNASMKIEPMGINIKSNMVDSKSNITTTTTTSTSSSTTNTGLKSLKIFEFIDETLKLNGNAICSKVNAIFHFEILRNQNDKEPIVYTIDMKNAPGSIKQGRFDKSDAIFTMTDQNLVALYEGKLNPNAAFLQGKMKVKGNFSAAMKFTPDLMQKPKL